MITKIVPLIALINLISLFFLEYGIYVVIFGSVVILSILIIWLAYRYETLQKCSKEEYTKLLSLMQEVSDERLNLLQKRLKIRQEED